MPFRIVQPLSFLTPGRNECLMLPEQAVLSQLQPADLVLACDLLRRDALVLFVASLYAPERLGYRGAERQLEPKKGR